MGAPGRIHLRSTKRRLHWFKINHYLDWGQVCAELQNLSIPLLKSPWDRWPALWAQVTTTRELLPNKEEPEIISPITHHQHQALMFKQRPCQLEAPGRPSGESKHISKAATSLLFLRTWNIRENSQEKLQKFPPRGKMHYLKIRGQVI